MTEQSPYAPPKANTDRPEQVVSQTSLILLAVIAVASYFIGLGEAVLRGSEYYNGFYIATIVFYAILAVAWYQADARKRQRPQSKGMVVAIFLILIVSIPVYLFRSRGAGKGAIATILFLLFLVTCSILSALGKMTVFGIHNV